MTTQEKNRWLRLSQRYRKLGVTAVNGAFAELENNLWEEGWSGNPLSYRQTDHGIHIEVMLRSIGEISLKYKDYDDFWNKVKDEEGAYKVAQPIYNKWSELLYPQIQLVNGLNQTKIKPKSPNKYLEDRELRNLSMNQLNERLSNLYSLLPRSSTKWDFEKKYRVYLFRKINQIKYEQTLRRKGLRTQGIWITINK